MQPKRSYPRIHQTNNEWTTDGQGIDQCFEIVVFVGWFYVRKMQSGNTLRIRGEDEMKFRVLRNVGAMRKRFNYLMFDIN